MKPDATRFTLTDVSGNAVIFVSDGEQDQEVWAQADAKIPGRLEKVIAIAKRFRDYKNDDDSASKALDTALATASPDDPALAEALVMRIEIASHRGEQSRMEECKERLSKLGVDESTITMLEEKHRTLPD